MANITKRVNKRASEHLNGEVAEVALLSEMKGALGLGAVGTVVARRTTERVMRDRVASDLEAEGGLAASFPSSSAIVAVTASRVIALESNGITFKAPSLVVHRSKVKAELIGRRGLGKRVRLGFDDGSGVEVDVGGGQRLNDFLEALA